MTETVQTVGPSVQPPYDRTQDRPNYANDDVPVLSFVYSLYCDVNFANKAYALWKVGRDSEGGGSNGKAAQYRAYLNNFKNGPKDNFPAAFEELVAVEVPRNRPDRDERYKPTRDQARETVYKYLVPELTHKATAEEPRPKEPVDVPFFSGDRPLLSALALIFINWEPHPPEDLALHGVPEEVCAVLRQVRRAPNGRPYLELDQVALLAPTLIRELTANPFPW